MLEGVFNELSANDFVSLFGLTRRSEESESFYCDELQHRQHEEGPSQATQLIEAVLEIR